MNDNISYDDILNTHAVIKPPEFDLKNLPQKRYRYIIDSRDRNTNRHTSPSNYVVELDDPLKEVMSVRLLTSEFPFNKKNITNNNNILHILREGVLNEYVIPAGKYNGEQLVMAIKNNTDDVFTNVSYDLITEKITFQSSADITFDFVSENQKRISESEWIDTLRKNSIARVLGFGISRYDCNTSESYESPFSVNLIPDQYIVMYMQKAKVNVSTNNNINQSFCLINKSSENNGYEQFSEGVTKNFNPPIAQLSSLTFKFKDYYGNLYDFDNKDHRFELLFTCMKQQSGYHM